MAEIIKTYTQEQPTLRFIGKRYLESDRINGLFAAKWEEWFQKGWFDHIIAQCVNQDQDSFPEAEAFIGLCRAKEGQPMEYWIGVFTPMGTEVAEGFEALDFPACKLGVCWVYGAAHNGEIYGKEELCAQLLTEQGHRVGADQEGVLTVFERYVCPRFTQADETGRVILDICFILQTN